MTRGEIDHQPKNSIKYVIAFKRPLIIYFIDSFVFEKETEKDCLHYIIAKKQCDDKV